MHYVPRDYQRKIIDFILSTPRCAVWAGMGMGKTSAVLEAIRQLKEQGIGPALVVAPLRVAQSTWPDEASKWDEFNSLSIKFLRHTSPGQHDIDTINFEMLPKLVSMLKGAWPYKIVVVDESTRLKSFRLRQGGKRARALGHVAYENVEHFVELTGTPAPNGLLDLWGQLWFLDKGQRLGKSYSEYLDRYFYSEQKRFGLHRFLVWRPFKESSAAIKEKVKDISVSVNPEDYFNLQENIINRIEVKLPEKAAKLYKELGRELYALLEQGGEVQAANAAVKTLKLLQIAGGAVYMDDNRLYSVIHSAKLDALESVIEEANGAPILCAYAFKHEAERIMKRWPKLVRMLDKNPQTIRDWNDGKIPLLLAHPASCGHGLNLQDGGNILVFFSCTWDLELHDQIIERIGAVRQAQSGLGRTAFIHYLIAKDTVDEAVQERLRTKRRLQDILLDKKHLLIGD